MGKKIGSTLIILLLCFVATASDASYLVLLKNGGRVATPFYWFEGRYLYFHYAGGTAGIERREVDRVLRSEEMERPGNVVVWNPGKKEPPPEPPAVKKVPETDKPREVEVKEEKVDFEAYKKKIERLNAELEGLLESQRQVSGMGDDDAKTKISEEMLKVSRERERLADEVKQKNKGKLPDGW